LTEAKSERIQSSEGKMADGNGFSLWATEFVDVIEAWRKWVRGDSEEELRLELSGDSAGESADMAGGCLRGYWLW
jgi:hypothetical protein